MYAYIYRKLQCSRIVKKEVTHTVDHIGYLKAQDDIQRCIISTGDYIKSEVLADDIKVIDNLSGEKIELTEGLEVVIQIQKI